jgi:Beta-propeller repeat
MKTRVLCFCCLVPLLASALGQTVAPTAHSGMPAQKVRIAEGYGRLPLAFEANQGQSDPQVKFLTQGAGYSLFLTSTEVLLTLRKASQQMPNSPTAKALPPLEQSAVLHMKLAGANAKTEVSGKDELPGKSNYFIGNDPKKWQPNVRQYAKVRYENVYPGVDLVYYGNQQKLEYDFVLQPGTDPSVIRLGIEGATKLRLEQGDLVLSSPAGNVHLRRPQIYQQVNGARREIRGGYVLNKNEVGFRIASYDRLRELIIDPVLSYSTLLGGNGFDYGNSIAVDTAGNAYVTGSTSSIAFPTANAIYPTKPGGEDAFITKFNADGSALVYSTHLGGEWF